MNKDTLRIFGLVLVIGAPVFFFLVFRPLSKIPRPPAPPHYYPLGVVKSVNDVHETEIDSVWQTVANDTFITQSGDPLVLDSLRDNVYVADFFFASCPSQCPIMSGQLQRVQNAFIKDRNFRIISFSVDPARDSVARLRQYAKDHDAITGRWYFATGPKAKTYKLANESFHLVAREDQDDGPEAFIHSEKFTLVDASGVIRGYYNGLDSSSVNKLMADIVLVLRETEQNYSFRKNPKKRGGLGKEKNPYERAAEDSSTKDTPKK
jgi:protein SCO1/2